MPANGDPFDPSQHRLSGLGEHIWAQASTRQVPMGSNAPPPTGSRSRPSTASSSRSALDGEQWRYDAQQSFLALDDPSSPLTGASSSEAEGSPAIAMYATSSSEGHDKGNTFKTKDGNEWTTLRRSNKRGIIAPSESERRGEGAELYKLGRPRSPPSDSRSRFDQRISRSPPLHSATRKSILDAAGSAVDDLRRKSERATTTSTSNQPLRATDGLLIDFDTSNRGQTSSPPESGSNGGTGTSGNFARTAARWEKGESLTPPSTRTGPQQPSLSAAFGLDQSQSSSSSSLRYSVSDKLKRLSRLQYNPSEGRLSTASTPPRASPSDDSAPARLTGAVASYRGVEEGRKPSSSLMTVPREHRTSSNTSTTSTIRDNVVASINNNSKPAGSGEQAVNSEPLNPTRLALSASKAGPIQPRELILPAINGSSNSNNGDSQKVDPQSDPSALASLERRRADTSTSTRSLETGRQATLPDVVFQIRPRGESESVSANQRLPSSSTRDAAQRIVSAASADPASPTAQRQGSLTDREIVELGASKDRSPSSLLPANGAPLSSKNVLTIALAKAQSAVAYDSSNSVAEAIEAYTQAVRLLQEVMERIAPKSGSKKKSSREEERRRLKVIHDTYTDRIRLLSVLHPPVGASQDDLSETSSGPDLSTSGFGFVAASTNTAQPRTFAVESSRVNDSTPIVQIRPTSADKEPESRLADFVAAGAAVVPRSSLVDRALDGEMGGSVESGSREILADTYDAVPSKSSRSNSQAHRRSESESSFQSVASGAALRAKSRSPVENTRLRFGEQQQFREKDSFVGSSLLPPRLSEEGMMTPATPYFDAQPSMAASPRSPFPRSEISTPDVTRPPLNESAPAERKTSAQSGLGLTDHGRTLSNQVSPMIPSAPLTASSVDDSYSPTGLQIPPPETPVDSIGGRRRRAATLVSNASSGSGQYLVNLTTTSGTISQRRKGSSPQADGLTLGDRSPQSGLQASSKTSPVPGSAGSFESSRKRALSQPGRRPSIQLSSNALASSYRDLEKPPATSVAAPAASPSLAQRLGRKVSMPLLSVTAAASLKEQIPATPLSAVPPMNRSLSAQQHPYSAQRYPSPVPSQYSGYHSLLAAGGLDSPWPPTNESSAGLPATPMSALQTDLSDLFPNRLASSQVFAMSSVSLTTVSHPRLQTYAPPLCQAERLAPPPSPPPTNRALLPFHQGRAVQASLITGSYITARLGIATHIWSQQTQASRLLVGLDSRIKAFQSLLDGVDVVERSASALLQTFRAKSTVNPGLTTVQASAFAKQLEDFDGLLIEVQNSLAKKTGGSVESYSPGGSGGILSPTTSTSSSMTMVGSNASTSSSMGRKSGGVFASTFQSKLSRGLDRMAKSASGGSNASGTTSSASSTITTFASSTMGMEGGANSLTSYLESLSRVLARMTFFEQHLIGLLRSKGTLLPAASASGTSGNGEQDAILPLVELYTNLPLELKRVIEVKLKRTSEFMDKVVVRLTYKDLAVLVDKTIKRAGTSLMD